MLRYGLAMPGSDVEVVVVGGGAAGIAAARRLCGAGVDCLVVEARPRLGGRAWTVTDASGFALDLGCGWLHSADRNPWRAVAEEQGAAIDRTAPPWVRPSLETAFPRAEQDEFQRGDGAFYARLEQIAAERDRCSVVGGARTGRPLERPHQCGEHLYQRRRMGSGFGQGFRPLRGQRGQLARGRGPRPSSPPTARICRRCSIARCTRSITAASVCGSRRARARSRPIRPS